MRECYKTTKNHKSTLLEATNKKKLEKYAKKLGL